MSDGHDSSLQGNLLEGSYRILDNKGMKERISR